MADNLERPVLLLYDKSKDTYVEASVEIGELIVDSELGFAYIKTQEGQIVPIKGAGYVDLLNYIKNTTAIGVQPLPNHSFHLDTDKLIPDQAAPAGVWKVRIPAEEGGEEFKEIAIITNGKNCIIYTGEETEEGNPITTTVEDLYLDYTAYKQNSGDGIADHESRIGELESNIADRIIDRVIYYKSFNNNEVQDILFKIMPSDTPEEVFKNEFESTIVLGTDDGTSINKHFLGLTVDNKEHTYSPNHFYIRDIGNVVDLAVKFYYRDGYIYIRPTQTEGEFILRDKSTNKGTFRKFEGNVAIESYAASGLSPADEIRPLGQARNEEATSFVINQPSHGFTGLVPAYYDATDLIWKKATLDNRATALLARIDNDYFYAYTSGHIKVPDDAQDLESNKMYYLSQTEEGKMQTEEPTLIYQEIGYCYAKNGIKWFAVSIGTPVELAPYVIKDFATKTEMSQRVRYVESTDAIQNISEPEGCVIIVADLENWHTRKVAVDKAGDNPVQLQNGLWANESASDKKILEELDKKYDKGTNTELLNQFPTASDLIAEVTKKLTVDPSFEGDFNTLLDMINGKLNIADLSQSMSNSSSTTAPSAAVFKQLVDLVQSIAEGGTGAIVPQDNTPVHVEEGTLPKSSTSIISSARVLYNPILAIEGQVLPRTEYSFVTNTGVITLNKAYSDTIDVKYVLIDVFPTDIRFIADTVGSIAAAPYASSLAVGDVIKILGKTTKYDGGGHLRIVASSSGLDGVAVGDKYLNKVPYSDGKEIYDTLLTSINSKVSTTTFNEYKTSNDTAVNNKLASSTFETYKSKNKSIIDGSSSDFHTISTNVVSWSSVGQSTKTFDVTFPAAPVGGKVYALASLLSDDGASGNCSFRVSAAVKSRNTYTVTITPILNGQVYTCKQTTMKAVVQVIANHS